MNNEQLNISIEPCIIDQVQLQREQADRIIIGFNCGTVAVGRAEIHLIERVYGPGGLEAALAQ